MLVPAISGTAWITGTAQRVVDPDDPFPNGFAVGDIWSHQDNWPLLLSIFVAVPAEVPVSHDVPSTA